MHIYEGLKEYLASNDYQYMHQYAKSCLHYSRTLLEKNEKLKYLNKALEIAIVSKSQIETKLNSSTNKFINITFAHVQYTLATIYSEICETESYNNIEHIEWAVEYVMVAISSPYNSDDYKRDNSSSIGIKKFIDYLELGLGQNKFFEKNTQETILSIINLARNILSNDNWENYQ